MAMGKRKQEHQESLWIAAAALPQSAAHPFYQRLNDILDSRDFDGFVERLCGTHYSKKVGRPSLPPAIYFRLLLIGYFEGIDSERGIAWRLADSLSLRRFCGYALTDHTVDHSTISRNRRLLPVEVHQRVFEWVLGVLAEEKLLDGKTIGIDATTLEANAALRSIVRRDTNQPYREYLEDLAKASGIETPTREDLAKLDRHREGKGSNDDWSNPHDPDARITKMKDGRTHLAHKAEHGVDMKTGAVLSVTLQPANRGDTASLPETLEQGIRNVTNVLSESGGADNVSDQAISELVADKGYHSNATLVETQDEGLRTYISEPNRGRRNWAGKDDERDAVYANRRRVKGNRGRRLMAQRGELIERSFAHAYDTGAMRRTHLRGHDNILKRLLVHIGGFNLSLILRRWCGFGTARGLQGLLALILEALKVLRPGLRAIVTRIDYSTTEHSATTRVSDSWSRGRILGSTTGC